MKLDSSTSVVSPQYARSTASTGVDAQGTRSTTPSNFGPDSSASIWAGPDGRGCIPGPKWPLPRDPSPFPIPRFPLPEPIPFPRCPPFPRPMPGPFPLPFPGGKVTLSHGDRATARDLREALSDPFNQLIGMMDPNAEKMTLRTGRDGQVRGPEGQPLVEVRLKGGQTAYVDPNTNQYYLQARRGDSKWDGRVSVVGPMDLPEEVQFSNSYFSDADCRALEKEANHKRRPFWDCLPLPWFRRELPVQLF